MRSKQIEPFPDTIDRTHFGSWLSGFVDGEGSFLLTCNYQSGRRYKQPSAAFSIQLRDDDREVIQLIQSYLQIGRTYAFPRQGSRQSQAAYRVFSLKECLVLCQHFHSFPLMAKKKRDFLIWERGVNMLNDVGRWSRAGRVMRDGAKKWSSEMITDFDALCSEIRAVREYKKPQEDCPV